jgi:hypothetical protein
MVGEGEGCGDSTSADGPGGGTLTSTPLDVLGVGCGVLIGVLDGSGDTGVPGSVSGVLLTTGSALVITPRSLDVLGVGDGEPESDTDGVGVGVNPLVADAVGVSP